MATTVNPPQTNVSAKTAPEPALQRASASWRHGAQARCRTRLFPALAVGLGTSPLRPSTRPCAGLYRRLQHDHSLVGCVIRGIRTNRTYSSTTRPLKRDLPRRNLRSTSLPVRERESALCVSPADHSPCHPGLLSACLLLTLPAVMLSSGSPPLGFAKACCITRQARTPPSRTQGSPSALLTHSQSQC